LNFDNGHRPRQGQHNKNRGRGRNNRRPGGGGGHISGGAQGNSPNRVYESNGPDVKVRGTAQTIAEKYMQLGRDAQSSGDNVMAESYFQFSEHYFRVMAAAQPVGQPTQQLRRPEDDDFEDEGDDGGEGENEAQPNPAASENPQGGSAPQADAPGQAPDMDRSEQRNFRQRDNRDGNRERFRPRWQNRRDQSPEGNADPQMAESQSQTPRDEPPREAVVEARSAATDVEAGPGQWEAPSFLRRPAAAMTEEAGEPVAEKRARAPRKPRVVDETPQGE
jgi:Domain of unknown function (DUF4167)